MGKSKYGKSVKQFSLELGYLDEVKKDLKNVYFNNGHSSIHFGDLEGKSIALERHKDAFYDCAYLYNKSLQKKRARVHKKVRSILASGSGCTLLTLTWSPENYVKLDTQTRRRKVQRFLKKWLPNQQYLANLDYNKEHKQYVDKNGEIRSNQHQEHYHILLEGRVPLDAINEWRKNEGKEVDAKRVRNGTEQQTANYCVKLGFHALKSFGIESNIIYSRNVL